MQEQYDALNVMTPIYQYTPSISVVIPTLNEAENLPSVLKRMPAWVHEIILVDGRSTDGTVEVAKCLCPKIRVVLEKRRGKGIALRSGFAAASGEIIVMMDADGSTDPGEIGAFVRMLRNGADYAKGSRFMQGADTADISPVRRWGNLGLTMLVRLLFGSYYSDLCYGFNAFWAHTLPALDLDADGFEIETQMNLRALSAGLRVVEVHSFEYERLHGQSHLQTFPDGLRVVVIILRELKRKLTQHPAKPVSIQSHKRVLASSSTQS